MKVVWNKGVRDKKRQAEQKRTRNYRCFVRLGKSHTDGRSVQRQLFHLLPLFCLKKKKTRKNKPSRYQPHCMSREVAERSVQPLTTWSIFTLRTTIEGVR